MSVSSVTMTTSIVEAGTPVSYDLTVRNHVSAAPRTAAVSLFMNSQRLDQRVQTIEEGEDRRVVLQGSPQTTGFQTGSVTLEGDDAEYDNTHWFVLNIPRERRVLLVGERPDMVHATLALSTGRTQGRSGFRLSTVSPSRLSAGMLKENDVFIVWDGTLREDIRRTLLEQIESGKGLILFPTTTRMPAGSPPTLSSYLPAGFSGMKQAVDAGAFLTIGRSDLDHPLFSGMFDKTATATRGRARLESPDVFAFMKSRAEGRSTPILTMSNGEPFLTELRMAEGRVLVFGVAPVPDWSTFPVSGLFVPLIHRSVVFVSGDKSYRPAIEPGEEITLRLPVDRTTALRLRSPDTEEVPVRPLVLPTGPVFRTREAVLPGVYSLRSGDEEIERFAVNLSSSESDISPLTEESIIGLATSLGASPGNVTILRAAPDLTERVRTARVGAELWGMLLVLALVVAVVETWLSSTLKAPESQEERV